MAEPHPDSEAIQALLEEGETERALEKIEKALESRPDSAELHSLRGWALWDLGDSEGASDAYEKALSLDPESSDLQLAFAETRFALLDFNAAETYARRASSREPLAAAFELLSRVAEFQGKEKEAESCMRSAHRLDPEQYPLPYRMSESEFLASAEEALSRLPDPFVGAMKEHLTLMVEPLPSRELLQEENPPLDPEILGLYSGVPLPEREPTRSSGKLPDRIYLFQRNIERVAEDREELVREIAVTLYHEIGHFLGMDEEDLEELDFG